MVIYTWQLSQQKGQTMATSLRCVREQEDRADEGAAYMPSPAEIAQRARVIREGGTILGTGDVAVTFPGRSVPNGKAAAPKLGRCEVEVPLGVFFGNDLGAVL